MSEPGKEDQSTETDVALVEASRRAHFFLRALWSTSKMQVETVCLSMLPQSGGAHEDDCLLRSVKLLTAGLAYVSLLEQEVMENSHFYYDWFVLVLKQADAFYEQPTSREIIDRYGSMTREILIEQLTEEFALLLNLPHGEQRVNVSQLFDKSSTYRAELFKMAFISPLAELQESASAFIF